MASDETINVPITPRRATVESCNLIRSIRHNDPRPKVIIKIIVPILQSDLTWLKANKVGEKVPMVRTPTTLPAIAVITRPAGTKRRKDRIV
jgi:hypothetical protein